MYTVINNATIINEGKRFKGSVIIENEIIKKISHANEIHPKDAKIIDAEGKILIPGIIDDQVHFREPGLTQKGDIYHESKAAVAGGVTSFMDMPNNNPPATTIELLEQKFETAAKNSFINYSFYLGATNNNANEIERIDKGKVCGVKVFMGSSTGNMLVDNNDALSAIFDRSPVIIATHCEDEQTIARNLQLYKEKYSDNIPVKCHPLIRSVEACVRSTEKAIGLAEKYGAKLHVLHLSTEKETELFGVCRLDQIPQITAEVCVHHLWFTNNDYDLLGNMIKCNPAIKTYDDRLALRNALASGKLSVIATDHAPHTLAEKQLPYLSAPSGIPLVQHSLQIMLELCMQGIFTVEAVVMHMCHMPAAIFNVHKRGFIREGYFADLALVDINTEYEVAKNNILYKCGWSPFEGKQFSSAVTHTWVNGNLVYENGNFDEQGKGKALAFDR